jgi:cytochrome o ubiquinol oxidase operon protein cyoD
MERAQELRAYLIGFGSSVLLTAVPFILVALHKDARLTLWTLEICAVIQVIVHLRYFLHLGLRGQHRDDLQLVLFTILILLILIGGTVWILTNLTGRM